MDRRTAFCLFLLCISLRAVSQQSDAVTARPDLSRDVRTALETLQHSPSEPCDASPGEVGNQEALFRMVRDDLERILRDIGPSSEAAELRTRSFLAQIAETSDEVNKSWPKKDRFHFEMLRVEPLLVVQVGIRSVETYEVFAPTESRGGNDKQSPVWQDVGSVSAFSGQTMTWEEIKLARLHRGPSGHARFLESVQAGGCAGSWGMHYEVREWDPKYGLLSNVLQLDGAIGLGDSGGAPAGPTKEHPFAQVGELKVDGSILQLPYCWFSLIDWWDNPSLCALDTYDLSGD